jgi:hypothetical protein
MTSDRIDAAPSRLTAAGTFVLEGEHACHECGCIVPVFGLLVFGPFALVGHSLLDPEDDSAILRCPVELPDDVSTALATRSGGHFRPDESKTLSQRCWMNHCRECGAKIGDWYVHKPGEAFFPTTEDELSRLRGELISGPHTFVEPDLAVSSWTSTWLTLAQKK